MKKLVLLTIALFCYLHIVRDLLQELSVRNWFTTFGHSHIIPDTSTNNFIGMVIIFVSGTLSLYFYARLINEN